MSAPPARPVGSARSAPLRRATGAARLGDVLEILPGYAEEVVLHTVRDTHRAWSRRSHGLVDRLTGGASAPVRIAHDAIAGSVYASLGLGLRAASVGSRALRGRGAPLDGPRGSGVHAALNGLLGDRLDLDQRPLAVTMAVRQAGSEVPLTPGGLSAAFPGASGRVAILVHGLGEHEGCWEHARSRTGSSYPDTLAGLGWTPVTVRFNSGLSVAANGVALAALVEDLVEAWPVEVTRIAFVGHSMGGLVTRAAGAVAGVSWPALTTDVVTLATPHLGADLAQAVTRGSGLLSRLPETAAFGRILDQRSVGIVDLTHGLPDLEPTPGVRYRLVSAELDRPWGPVLGDLLVRRGSATGSGRRTRRPGGLFPGADVVQLSGTDHFGVLNHPEVHAALGTWLG